MLFKDLFSRSFPPLGNVKLFVDAIGISSMLNDESPLSYSWSSRSLSCTSYRSHRSIPTRWTFILMEMSLSFTDLFYALIISYLLIEEKKQKIQEILKIIHISPLINAFAWSLRAFVIELCLSLSLVGQLVIVGRVSSIRLSLQVFGKCLSVAGFSSLASRPSFFFFHCFS